MNEDTSQPDIQDEETSGETASDTRRKRMWQIFGWSVIGALVLLIVLNLFQWVSPEINQYALPVIVVLYVVYVFFRKR